MSNLANLISKISSTAGKAIKTASQLKPTSLSKNDSNIKGNALDNPNDPALEVKNPFTKIIKAANLLPESVQSFVLTQTFSRIVPYVGTTGIVYEEVTPNKLVVSLENNKGVQNHIGSIHAVAVTLLAETATGFLLGLNLPSDRILLVKSYEVNFYRPTKKGQMAAIATLTDEQRQYILDNPKGDMVIPCIIEDREADNTRDPITVAMTWAWFPKKELDARRNNKSKQS